MSDRRGVGWVGESPRDETPSKLAPSSPCRRLPGLQIMQRGFHEGNKSAVESDWSFR